jgi:hypothetical protein
LASAFHQALKKSVGESFGVGSGLGLGGGSGLGVGSGGRSGRGSGKESKSKFKARKFPNLKQGKIGRKEREEKEGKEGKEEKCLQGGRLGGENPIIHCMCHSQGTLLAISAIYPDVDDPNRLEYSHYILILVLPSPNPDSQP